MRFMAARSVNEGRKAATVNVLFVLPISSLVVSNAGWIGRAIVNVFPGQIDPSLDANDVFVAVTNLVAKPGVFGFIIATRSAALMSTVDTLVNAWAAVFVNDIYKPLVRKELEIDNDTGTAKGKRKESYKSEATLLQEF